MDKARGILLTSYKDGPRVDIHSGIIINGVPMAEGQMGIVERVREREESNTAAKEGDRKEMKRKEWLQCRLGLRWALLLGPHAPIPTPRHAAATIMTKRGGAVGRLGDYL